MQGSLVFLQRNWMLLSGCNFSKDLGLVKKRYVRKCDGAGYTFKRSVQYMILVETIEFALFAKHEKCNFTSSTIFTPKKKPSHVQS